MVTETSNEKKLLSPYLSLETILFYVDHQIKPHNHKNKKLKNVIFGSALSRIFYGLKNFLNVFRFLSYIQTK